MIGPDASAFGFARRSSSASATRRTRSSRSSRFSFCFAETSANWVVPPHSSGCSPSVVSSVRHPLRVRVGDVDLVHGDDDRHAGGARVRDRLARLRHHAVVRGDDEHGDVGHLRAAGAHRGERLVARCVEERDLAAVPLDLVGADVLGDAARLALGDRGLADRVEQRRLAVVDVTHDRHDRRPRDEVLLDVLEGLGLLVLVGGVLDRDLALDLGRDQLHGLVGERLGDGDHLPEGHHDLDDLRDRDPERAREVLDGHPGRNGDRAGRLDDLARLLGRSRGAVARGLTLVARALADALDHDAPLAARPRGALTGPHGAIRLVGLRCFVSHRCQCRGARAPARLRRCAAARG